MNKQMLFGVFVLALMGCLAGVPAHAQDMGKISVFGGYTYQVNSQGIDSCEFSDFCGIGSTGLHGYTAAATYSFSKNIGLEANFSGHNGGGVFFSQMPTSTSTGFQDIQTQDIYTYTFGPKLTLPMGNFAVFTHFLVGGAHTHSGIHEVCTTLSGTCSSDDDSFKGGGNGFAFKTGGGLDWNHHRWGIRILEVDYVHTSVSLTGTESCSECTTTTTTFPSSSNNFELSTGIKFNF